MSRTLLHRMEIFSIKNSCRYFLQVMIHTITIWQFTIAGVKSFLSLTTQKLAGMDRMEQMAKSSCRKTERTLGKLPLKRFVTMNGNLLLDM